MRMYSFLLLGIIFAMSSRTTSAAPVRAALPINGGPLWNAAVGSNPSAQPEGFNGYQRLYAFGRNGSSDGSSPASSLINVAGELYGTTTVGGGTPCISGFGCGTVFKVSTSGKESVLYRFKGASDGEGPEAGLTAMNGELYGTTTGGGEGTTCNTFAGTCGTVFKVSKSGKESVLYKFTGGADGAQPWGNLLAVNGKLYGTTIAGGANNYGTVFSLTTAGKVTVLHGFSNVADGAYPYAGLTSLNGKLYGTTYAGGTGAGYGTVFEISLSGQEHVIYSFLGDGMDGQAPQASLLAVNGKLYGTTVAGGTNNYGTVFEVTTSGQETVLYRFGGTTEANPTAALIAGNGALYGTTFYGGPFICNTSQHIGCGTVFKLSTSGKLSVLHNFRGTSDGEYPQAGLVPVNGMLYGTTFSGGASGAGTVFKVSP
jgi:uncharacterized repeat protein (TIGR03803 family)